jgi:glycosyltransferase involved in cell wall biosynthesis
MKKIAILTAYTDKNNWTHTETCDFTQVASKNHIDYCYIHNYTYLCELFKEVDYIGYHPTWVKIFALKKHLGSYDYVVWIDSDCVFTNNGISIESLIDNSEVSLILAKSEKDFNTNIVWTGITTGFMVFKNDEFSHKLLDVLLQNANNYKQDYFHEQSVLDNYLRDVGYYNNIPELLDKTETDLESITTVQNLSFLPYEYHRCINDGKYKFLYHAGGNSLTKKERLSSVLNGVGIKFGIYTSFYNCEEFVENAFKQIESLNYENFEWHITDDFSDDKTKDLIKDRITKSPISHKIKFYEQSLKKQMYWAPNEFFDKSFEWIVLMDADDEVDSDFLKIYNSTINENNDVVLVSSDFHKVDYPENRLHSISYIINDEPISSKIKRYHPACDYLNNTSYSCFGTLRAFKNLKEIEFEISDRMAGAEDSYHVFWVNSYGKYLHIPRPLYKWNKHQNSESHSKNIISNFNGNFEISLNKLNSSDFGVDTTYNDLYIETCALGSYEFGKLKGKSVSLWTKSLNETQTKKLTNLYVDCKLNLNKDLADIHVVCLNNITERKLMDIVKNNKNSTILLYYQNTKLHLTNEEKDEELNTQLNKYSDILRSNYIGFAWWSYIRHFKIIINN